MVAEAKEGSPMKSGTVKWFDEDDIRVHYSGIIGQGWATAVNVANKGEPTPLCGRARVGQLMPEQAREGGH